MHFNVLQKYSNYVFLVFYVLLKHVFSFLNMLNFIENIYFILEDNQATILMIKYPNKEPEEIEETDQPAEDMDHNQSNAHDEVHFYLLPF